jgi:DNA-binding MarR family transcriptional regulator
MPMRTAKGGAISDRERDEIEETASAVLTASRALMGVAVRSIASIADDVTLLQYRALVLIISRREPNVSDLAEALGIHPSTATRLCDRLAAKDLVTRVASSESGRETSLKPTPVGRAVVRGVSARRRKEVTRIVEQMPRDDRHHLRFAFAAFAVAAGEVALPDDAWKLGWTS